MKKRILAIVLSCLMVLSLVPFAVLAEEAECEHEYVETILKDPTCTDTGVKKITCKKCDVRIAYQAIDPHPLDEGTVLEAATCGESGKMLYACTVCDYTVEKAIPATGEHEYEDGVIDATCTEPGKAGSICAVCGTPEDEDALVVIEGLEALGHDWILNEESEDYVATECEKGGVNVFECSRCDEKKTETTEAAGHEWDEGVLKEAGCEVAQHVLYNCLHCDAVKIEETGLGNSAALGHDWKDSEVVKPTCKEDGYTLQACARCGGTQKVDAVPATGHELYEEIVAATCKAGGYTVSKCKNCDFVEKVAGSDTAIDPEAHKMVKTDLVLKEATCAVDGVIKTACEYCGKTGYDKLVREHKWDDGVVKTPANCTEEGEMLYTCTYDDCGETKIEVIPVTHVEVEEVVVVGNCGKDTVIKVTCELCDYESEKTVAATGDHDYQEDVVDATCTEPAMVGITCTVCGDVKSELEPVEGSEALGHKLTAGVVREADCLKAQRVHYECEVCDYEYEEETGLVDALGHDLKKGTVVKPTCTEEGYTPYACKRCDYSEKRSVKDPTGHTMEAIVVAPTCTEKGYTKHECKNCDYAEENTDIVDVDTVNGHKAVTVKVLKAATCTEPGVQKLGCKYCEISMGYGSIAAGHKWDKGAVVDPATCTEDGVKEFTCTVCEKVADEEDIAAYKLNPVIKATGHKTNADNTKYTIVFKEATCGEAGERHFYCTNGCGELVQKQAIKATGKHVYEDVAIDATCLEGAYGVSKCNVCGAEKDKAPVEGSLPLGHDYVETLLPADCLNAQRVEYKCSRCNHSYVEETGLEDALGHDWDEGVVFEPECGVEGYTLFTCKTCKTEEKRDVVAALEHNYVADVIAPTCAAEGYTNMVCEHCEDTYLLEGSETEKNPDNHTPVRGNVIKEANCEDETAGVAKKVCADCGASCGYESIPYRHEFVGSVKTEATCVKNGEMQFVCSTCNKKANQKLINEYKLDAVIPAGHSYDDGVVTTEATCGKDGVLTYTCTVCDDKTKGHSYTEAIKATGEHDMEEGVIDATCTTPAMVGVYCKVCKYSEEGMTEIGEALGHTLGDYQWKDATCTEAAYSYAECLVCDYVEYERDIPGYENPLGHDFDSFEIDLNGKHTGHCARCDENVREDCTIDEETVEIIEATCTSGTKIVANCAVCEALVEIDNDGVKNPANHTYGKETVLKEATCTATGISKFTCECSDKEYKYLVTSMKEHAWQISELTGTEEHISEDNTYVYRVCGDCEFEEIIEILEGYVCKEHPADQIVVVEGTAATCHKTGLTDGKKCNFCGTMVEEQKVIEKTQDHHYEFAFESINDKGEYVATYVCPDCDSVKVVTH